MTTLSGWLMNLIRGGLPAGGAKLASVDPVCGMKVSPETSERYDYHFKTYHFCSRHCLASFRADPAKYANKAAGGAPVAH